MLTLSRKVNETIRIGNDIEIRIKRIEGDTVKIGIVAPESVGIVRGELFAEVQQSNVGAVSSTEGASIAEALRVLRPQGAAEAGANQAAGAEGESVK